MFPDGQTPNSIELALEDPRGVAEALALQDGLHHLGVGWCRRGHREPPLLRGQTLKLGLGHHWSYTRTGCPASRWLMPRPRDAGGFGDQAGQDAGRSPYWM